MKKFLLFLALAGCGGPEGLELEPTDGPEIGSDFQELTSSNEYPYAAVLPWGFTGGIPLIADASDLTGIQENTSASASWAMLTDAIPVDATVLSYTGCARIKNSCPNGFCANGNGRVGVNVGSGVAWSNNVTLSQTSVALVCKTISGLSLTKAQLSSPHVTAERFGGIGVKLVVLQSYGYATYGYAPTDYTTWHFTEGGCGQCGEPANGSTGTRTKIIATWNNADPTTTGVRFYYSADSGSSWTFTVLGAVETHTQYVDPAPGHVVASYVRLITPSGLSPAGPVIANSINEAFALTCVSNGSQTTFAWMTDGTSDTGSFLSYWNAGLGQWQSHNQNSANALTRNIGTGTAPIGRTYYLARKGAGTVDFSVTSNACTVVLN